MATTNRCRGCTRSCCKDFKVAMQKRDPDGYRQLLERFPFIKITAQELTFFNGREAVMNVHNCERLQPDGSCLGYDSVERPQFCYDAGEKWAPHKDCLTYDFDKDGT